MNYEKKYNEALERAKELKKYGACDMLETIDKIFPELKKSEDERIRKAMIDFFKHEREEGITVLHYGLNIECMIAWLEKQGEQPSISEEEIEIIKKKAFKEGRRAGIAEAHAEMAKHQEEKQGEQKTAEPILSKEVDSQIWQIANNAGITYDQSISLLMATKKAYDKGKEDAIKEQKHAKWSDYDNEMFLHCCAAIRVADYSSIDDRNMMEKWFRNLKDRVQPKQEWSEEDRGNLLDVKCIIDKVWHNQYVREEIDHSGEELESLWHWLDKLWQRVEYHQNRWKPSEEEMKALELVLDYHTFANPDNRKQIQLLHKNLKNLTE